jgi:uracil-DNA glycosylase
MRKGVKLEFQERNINFNGGNLERWFKEENIFLLNSALTVQKKTPGSHMHIWEEFTDDVIKFISDQNPKCVFLLLGAFAKSKQRFIQNQEKNVLGIHPSPLSAHAGFFGSEIFKKIEEKIGEIINWTT